MILCLHPVLRIYQKNFRQHSVALETFCLANTSIEAPMSVQPLPLVIGKLTVTHYSVLRDGVNVPQWIVSSKDGKLVQGPFSSLEKATEFAEEASDSGSASQASPCPK
jgi:hypothetical protein